MNDKTIEQFSELPDLIKKLERERSNLVACVADLTKYLIKTIEKVLELRDVNSVMLCPFCDGIPRKGFVCDPETSEQKFYLFCSHCGERSGDYSDSIDEAIEDWNEWASIDDGEEER